MTRDEEESELYQLYVRMIPQDKHIGGFERFKLGYQAALTEVMSIVEDCDGDLDFAIFKIKQLIQALAEGKG